MCRLYGFFATRAVTVECGLFRARNALAVQSAGDSRGMTHRDGWGIACYSSDPARWILERRASAARAGDLEEAVRGRRASAVVSHVRRASVGQVSVENTHPFLLGMTCLAHNGTIPEFEKVGPEMEKDLSPFLRSRSRGQTDSELLFLWLRARAPGPEVERGTAFHEFVRTVAGSVRRLLERCRAGTPTPASLNFVMTNGRYLLALRCNESLHWIERDEHTRCEICQDCQCRTCEDDEDAPGRSYRSVAVASEPLTGEDWHEVPNHHFVVVDRDAEVAVVPLSGALAGP